MKWIKDKLRNWVLHEDIEENNRSNRNEVAYRKVQATLSATREEEGIAGNPVRLSIFKANGGFVVETRSYDSKTDRLQTNLHIIGNDQELGEGIAKVITIESLRI